MSNPKSQIQMSNLKCIYPDIRLMVLRFGFDI